MLEMRQVLSNTTQALYSRNSQEYLKGEML